MSPYELFQSQTMSILTLLADTARAEIYRVYHDNTDTEKELKLAQLNAVMEFLAKEAVRKICLLFKLCSVEKECNAVDLASSSERSGNAQSLPEPKESSLQPEYAQTIISGADAYLLSGEKPPALPPTASPHQDVIREDECPATQEPESATAASSSVKVDKNGKKIQTSLIMKEAASSAVEANNAVITPAVQATVQPAELKKNTSNKCDVCERTFTMKRYLMRHKQVHSKTAHHTCNVCGNKYRFLRALNKHLLSHGKKKRETHPCKTCGKSFVNLDKHELIHLNVKPYLCGACGKGFTLESVLLVHQRLHTGEKPYQCETCGKRFTQSSTLHIHKRVHSEVKPWKCSLCDKSFKRQSSLKKHSIVHTGEKPHTCEACGQKFGHRENLKRHVLNHSGIKQYACTVCGKRYSQMSSLKEHMPVHGTAKPFMCETCGKTFVYNYALKNHMWTHIDTRNAHGAEKNPKCCEVCGKCYSSSYALKMHQRLHSEDSPFNCKVKNPISVKYVAWLFAYWEIYGDIIEFTLERSHLVVKFVGKALASQTT
ncbi:hypothetical protein QTP86_006440 [Hemibagrus guttatus]|nr:hypothetical protein QTP86_006440 [Hemibagrus guttatus]